MGIRNIFEKTFAGENANRTEASTENNGEFRESSVMPQMIKAMEHDISDAPVIDPVAVYKAVEEGVVGAYKAVEKGAVDAYRKVEDTMVDKLFRKDGETVEQAKERLRRS